MKNIIKSLCIAVVIVIAMGQTSQAAVKTGGPAPDFSLMDTYGKSHSLSGYKGKYVVLEWLNHDCPFVKKHYGSNNMQMLQNKYTKKGVVWLSVNSSAEGKQGNYKPDEANQLTKTKGASPSAVLLDSDGKIGRMYGAKTTPHIFIVDPSGKVIYQGAIDSIPSANPGDISKARNYIQSSLDSAMSGKPVVVPQTNAYGCSVKY